MLVTLMKKLFLIARILFSLMFINSGLNKFFNYLPPPDDMPEKAQIMFSAMAQIGWLLPLVAVVEILGGILFLSPKFRALAIVILAPIMVGILLANLSVAPEGLFIFIPLLAIYIWAIARQWPKFSLLLK